ncbi:MAG: divalent-cation tolerance protein CutA [Desulfatitalea sp.]|nr:divalent-cation tolerance protein CutA [Desulfatitalea sp.]NNJ99597.1 divalent-cation tolerance protein CutA [Desulfatitalea sp.]
MDACLIYVTTKDIVEARMIGRHLVTSRLAACVNIIDGINSIYLWNDEIQDDQEVVLIAKTSQARVPELTAEICAKHSYDCPCVVSLPITDGNPAFLSWIGEQTVQVDESEGPVI